jgi:uncharacterized protein (DUF433 family)
MALERITVDPAVCLGQPTIRGTRITVSVLLRLLGSGHPPEEVLDAYPELTLEDINQSLQYAAWVVTEQTRVAPGA